MKIFSGSRDIQVFLPIPSESRNFENVTMHNNFITRAATGSELKWDGIHQFQGGDGVGEHVSAKTIITGLRLTGMADN